MPNKVSRTIYITEAQDENIDKLKSITRIPKAELHRMALELLFADYSETLALEPGESPQLVTPRERKQTFVIGDSVNIAK